MRCGRLQQRGELLLQLVDRVDRVGAEVLARAVHAVAEAVPHLAFRVARAHEEREAPRRVEGRQHQHRLGLGKAAQVVEIAVLPVADLGVARLVELGRGGQYEHGVVHAGEQALAARAQRFGVGMRS